MRTYIELIHNILVFTPSIPLDHETGAHEEAQWAAQTRARRGPGGRMLGTTQHEFRLIVNVVQVSAALILCFQSLYD